MYLSPNISDQMEEDEIGGACSTHGGEEKCYRVLVENPGTTRSLGRHVHKCENNIKMEHTERR